MSNQPWFRGGTFEIKTCLQVEAYLAGKTNIKQRDIHVHKTEKYLVVSYVKKGRLYNHKTILPGGVLYCLKEEHLIPLLKEMA